MRIINIIILTSLFLHTSSILAANNEPEQTPWYQVELILFEHASIANIQSEKWPNVAVQPDTNNMIKLNDHGKPNKLIPYALINNKEKLLLSDIYKSLKKSSREKVILYRAWMQPTVNKEDAKPVHIHGGIKYPNDISLTNQGSYGSPVPEFSDKYYPRVSAPAIIEQIDGSVTISVSRYLHIWTDILYSHPVSQGFSSDPNAKEFKLIRFPMKQHRRMRSNEIHYLDHPLYGILVHITPIELPKPEETQEESEKPVESKESPAVDTGKSDIKKGKINNNTSN